MKKVIFTALVGFGLLFTSFAAHSSISRILNIYVEGAILYGTSDAASGQITTVDIYDDENQLVLVQHCSGYKFSINLAGLPSGTYEAGVISTKDKKGYAFSL